MADSTALAVSYTAADGVKVDLDMQSVTKYVLTGSAQCSDAELATFMGVCQARRINPLAKEAYLVKYGSSPAATIVSKDYYTRVAREQDTFDGFEAGVVVVRPDGSTAMEEGSLVAPGCTLVGGWARVYDKGVSRPYCETVALDEYSTGKSGWAKMPATMIRKVALVHALREAYPGVFGGLYDAGEMDQARDGAMRSPIPARGVRVSAAVQSPQPARAPKAKHARQALAPEEAEALGVLADWLAGLTGEDASACKSRMVKAVGNPLDEGDFASYYDRASAWANAEAEMYGEPAQAVEVEAEVVA